MFQYPSTVPDNPNPPQMMPAIPHLHHPRIKPDPDIENAVVTTNVCMNHQPPIYSVEVPNKYVYSSVYKICKLHYGITYIYYIIGCDNYAIDRTLRAPV